MQKQERNRNRKNTAKKEKGYMGRPKQKLPMQLPVEANCPCWDRPWAMTTMPGTYVHKGSTKKIHMGVDRDQLVFQFP